MAILKVRRELWIEKTIARLHVCSTWNRASVPAGCLILRTESFHSPRNSLARLSVIKPLWGGY